jgi:ATP phosphoribosyltransferase regulatory subunit
MTSLVARTVATLFGNRERPIRLCYSGEVFRWDEPRGGRQYEFHQIGLEHIGSDRLEADTEALVVAIEALTRLGLKGFTITLSHVGFFNGIVESLRLGDGERQQMREMTDRKETEQLDAFLEKYTDPSSRAAFCRLTTLAGSREIIDEARSLITGAKSVQALDDLESVYRIAEEIGIAAYIDIDLGDVGGLDYYTGLTFKIFAPGLGTALGRGGRYDQLLAKFGHAEPAVGFSLCLDWLAGLLGPDIAETGKADPEDATRLQTDGDIASAFKQANLLRSAGRKIKII